MQDQSLYSQMNINPTFPEQEHLNCPRCDSPNTKFCYYNNYNLSQPRHFCKNCKRYWTKGGALRNIPIGGCSRKHSKRSSTTKHHPSSTTPSSSVTAMATGSLSSPKAAVNEDHRLFNAILEPVKEGHSGNLDHGLSPDRPNLSLGEFVNSNSGLGSGSGSGMVINDDQEEGHASKVGKNNSSTSSCWKSGSNWTDLSIFTPSSSLK